MIGVAVGPSAAAVQVFPLRDGAHGRPLLVPPRERGRRGARPRCSSSSASSTTARRRRCRRRSSCRAGWATRRALATFLSELRGSRVEVRAPERGEKRRLQELAQQNAELALSSETFVAETKRLRRVEALEELREALNLESLPIRIECFDISNIQGQEIVGSMVVFEDARREEGALPQVRRRRGQDGQDDFAAMAEVVSRRFAPARGGRDDRASRTSRSRATPNLVVIDGGKGQLSAALAAMQRVRPAARRRDRAREARSRRCSSRAGRDPIVLPGALAGPAAAAADPRRGAPLRDHVPPPAPRRARRASRCSTSSRASARCGGGRCSSTSARPSASLAASAEELEGVPGRAGEDGAADLRAAAPRRPRSRSHSACSGAVSSPGSASPVVDRADRSTSRISAPLVRARDQCLDAAERGTTVRIAGPELDVRGRAAGMRQPALHDEEGRSHRCTGAGRSNSPSSSSPTTQLEVVHRADRCAAGTARRNGRRALSRERFDLVVTISLLRCSARGTSHRRIG